MALTPGCGGSSDDGRLATMGMPGIPSPVIVSQNILLVDTALDGHPGGRLLADTGSPFTLIDPSGFPGATLPATTKVSVDLTFGELTVEEVPALQLSVTSMDTVALAGIVGGNVFRQFSTQFNYRDRLFRLGEGSAPADLVSPAARIPFGLEGGGTVELPDKSRLDFAATRVTVTANVEGVDRLFILDTGASEVAVRSRVFEALKTDGRTVLAGLPITTASGPAQASVVRAKTITLGGETVSNAAVMTIGDELLDNLTTELGRPVDGLLGGNFLREFLVTVDYPKKVLSLQRYTTRDHIVDEFERVGVEIFTRVVGASRRIVLSTVFANSDAARKGLRAGDELTAIDGQVLDGTDPFAADRLLNGVPGTLKKLTLGQAGDPLLAHTTVDVLVDDLLPDNP